MNRRLFSLSALAALVALPFRSAPKHEAQAEANRWKAECLEALEGTDATSVGGLIAHQRAELYDLRVTLDAREKEIARLMGAMYSAWAVIANAYAPVEARGVAPLDISEPHPTTVQFTKDWKAAADRWRDEDWHPALNRNTDEEKNPRAVEIQRLVAHGVVPFMSLANYKKQYNPLTKSTNAT